MGFENIGIRVVVQGAGAFTRDMRAIDRAVSGTRRNLASSGGVFSSLSKNINSLGNIFTSFGAALTVGVTIPLAALTTGLIASGITFEDAFAGVSKTVDGVSDNFGNLTVEGEKLQRELRGLSLIIPITSSELAGVMQVAGQLGVRGTQNLLDFTESAAKLGIATDFTAEQAAIGFAKLGNIVGVEAEDMGQFLSNAGNAVVELGNNFAATEPEILNMTLRLAGVGNAIGLTTPQILGISTAMVAMGLRAEMGGSAVSRIFLEMQSAVNSGGKELTAYADVLGITESQFSSMFKSDPNRLFLMLLDSFDKLNQEGELSAKILEGLNLDTIRTQDTMNRLAPNVDLVTEAQAAANEQWSKQTALQVEFQKKVATTASQLKLLKNGVTELGITLFFYLKPAIDKIVGGLQDLVQGFTEFFKESDANKKQILKIVGALLVLGPALTAVGLALRGIASIPLLFGGLFKLMAFITSPLVIAGVLAISAAFLAFKLNLFGIKDTLDPIFARIRGVIALQEAIGVLSGDTVTTLDKLKIVFNAFNRELKIAAFLIVVVIGLLALVKILNAVMLIFNVLSAPFLLLFANPALLLGIAAFAGAFLLIRNNVLGLGDVFNYLSGVVKTLWESFNQFTNVSLNLENAFKALLAGDIDEALKNFRFAWEGFVFWFKNFAIPILKAEWEKLKPIIVQKLKDLGNAVLKFLRGVLAKIILKLMDWGAAFVDWVKDIWKGLKDKLSELKESIESWIEDRADDINDQLSKWKDAFIDWASGVWETLKSTNFAYLIGFIIGWIIGKSIALIIQLGKWAEAFYNWAEKVWPVLKEKFKILAMQIFLWIVGLGERLTLKVITEWVPALVDWVDGVWSGKEGQEGLKAKLENLWTNLKNWVKNDAKDDLVAAFTSILDAIIDVGKNLGKGLIEGILSGLGLDVSVDDLENGIKDLGKVIQDEVFGFFGINSPSKLSMEWGKSITEGLALGLENNIPQVKLATDALSERGVAAQLQSALSVDAMLGGATSGNTNTSSVSNSSTFAPTINGVPMQDERSAGNEIVRAWRMAQVTGNVL